jgi:hypothetical protein
MRVMALQQRKKELHAAMQERMESFARESEQAARRNEEIRRRVAQEADVLARQQRAEHVERMIGSAPPAPEQWARAQHQPPATERPAVATVADGGGEQDHADQLRTLLEREKLRFLSHVQSQAAAHEDHVRVACISADAHFMPEFEYRRRGFQHVRRVVLC